MIKTRKFLNVLLSGLLVLLVLASLLALMGSPLAQAGVSLPDHTEPLRLGLLKPAAAPIPAETCWGTAGSRICSLYANVGELALPDGITVPIWGFTMDGSLPGELPGPPLVVYVGETVTVNFTNQIPGETISVLFNGQEMVPDLVGVPTGSMATYTFTATRPGTFLYEAGVTQNGDRQVLMGLYGALIVRPGPLSAQAYADPGSAFDVESLLVFSEVDPLFNANPTGFNMYEYQPKYWLINGKAYPQSETIPAPAGSRLLLRYINAGADRHTIATLGVDQQILAADGNRIVAGTQPTPLDPISYQPYTQGAIAEGIPGGQTTDVLIQIPSAATAGAVFPLYDASMLHTNNGARLPNGQLGFGGILSFIETSGGPAPVPGGPLVNQVSAAPSPTTTTAGVFVTAQASPVDPAATSIAAMQYFVGSLANGPYPMSFDGFSWSADLSAPDPLLWTSASHPIYVQAQDDLGQWGPISSTVLVLDYEGPEIAGAWLTPNPTNGTRDVTLHGTAVELYTGRQSVVAAHYHFDGGAPVPLALNHTDSIAAALEGVLPAADLAALPEGVHNVEITAVDALGNEGLPGIIQLALDKTGPAGGVTVTPASLDLTAGIPVTSVRIEASFIDPAISGGTGSTINRAELFLNAPGADGSGQQLIPVDGLLDSASESLYFNIPVANFSLLSSGTHEIYVHARDAAGNWGDMAIGTINIVKNTDNVGPSVTSLVASPNPTAGAATVTLTAEARDVDNISAIVAAEWYIDPTTPVGSGFAMSPADGLFNDTRESLTAAIDVSAWPDAVNEIKVRAMDSAGNWGLPATMALSVTGNTNPLLVFSANFEEPALSTFSRVHGAVTVDGTAQLSSAGGSLGLVTSLVDGEPAYVSKRLPLGEKHVKVGFFFDPNGAQLGGEHLTILEGEDFAGRLFAIELEQNPDGGYEIRVDLRTPEGMLQTEWHHIRSGANDIRLYWRVSHEPKMMLSINGELVETILYQKPEKISRLSTVNLGPVSGVAPDMTGSLKFDNLIILRDSEFYLPGVMKR